MFKFEYGIRRVFLYLREIADILHFVTFAINDSSLFNHLPKSISQDKTAKGQKLWAVWMTQHISGAFWVVSVTPQAYMDRNLGSHIQHS